MSSPSSLHTSGRGSFYPNTDLPPPPPPKPVIQGVNAAHIPTRSTSISTPHTQELSDGEQLGAQNGAQSIECDYSSDPTRLLQGQDRGNRWVPWVFEDKSKQQLAEILDNPKLLSALTHSKSTSHPSLSVYRTTLQDALNENIALASHLKEIEERLIDLRSITQAQLLSAHALERQWRQKEVEMERALTAFAPHSQYQMLCQAIRDQESFCSALEENFLDGDGGFAKEREVVEWVRKFRESRKIYHSRQARKERWDEGRIGGWR